MKTANKRASRGKTNAAGRELMAALHELHDAVMGGNASKEEGKVSGNITDR